MRLRMRKESWMGRACSMLGRKEECIQGLGRKIGQRETTRESGHRCEDNIVMRRVTLDRVLNWTWVYGPL
jgi:hypothetical protein